MTDKDFEIVNAKIDDEKIFLNTISQDIWKTPELCYKEVHAHALLTCALKRHGFDVQKHYFMPTAFRAEFVSGPSDATTVAILLEYDALPEIGHGCGHNLIAEAGLAAAIAVKAAMKNDSTIAGKLVVLGTPAEEGGGGKIKLIEFGAFDDVDVALMVHPAPRTFLYPFFLSSVKGSAHFKGREAHAAASPWDGVNALDAAVSCYQSIAQLRQHIKSNCRINAIITKSGSAVNVIPADTSMDFLIRAPTTSELKQLLARVQSCITSAATSTGCEVEFNFTEEDVYENLVTNSVLITAFQQYLDRLGFDYICAPNDDTPVGSTDMGNVSHKIPSIHPLYAIPAEGINHTKKFTKASGADNAQLPTLQVSKAIAMTALQAMRNRDFLEAAREQFQFDIQEEENMTHSPDGQRHSHDSALSDRESRFIESGLRAVSI